VKSSTKQHWHNVKEQLDSLQAYTPEITRDVLLENEIYKKYIGKAKNRTFIKEDPRLYKSVLVNTSILKEIFTKQKTYKSSYNLTNRIKFIVEHNYNINLLRCKCGKTYNWTKYCRLCPDYKRNQLGKPHTEETKLKMRLSTIAYLEQLKGQLAPRYNKESITLIEDYGKKHGYKFMHAENGGEFYVKELGYFLDAYDPIFNIALEIDEKHHFNNENNLIDKDILRQKLIEEKLGCKFIRIRYDRVSGKQ
jgi:hypothetical protein